MAKRKKIRRSSRLGHSTALHDEAAIKALRGVHLFATEAAHHAARNACRPAVASLLNSRGSLASARVHVSGGGIRYHDKLRDMNRTYNDAEQIVMNACITPRRK